MAINTTYFQKRLEDELKDIVKELKTVGRINPDNPEDWEALPEQLEALPADSNELADTFEELEGNTAILKQLEIRYNEIKDALRKIKEGTYGICEVGKEEIEQDRLEANPAARTCKKHMA